MLISESRITSYIVIEKEKCKACQYCIAVCPKGVIGVAGDINKFGANYVEPIEEKVRECSGCKSCAIMCPDVAISVFRNRILENEKIS
jgi:2-oxoglutarate ferredoxin oxidoreductase subunit delta